MKRAFTLIEVNLAMMIMAGGVLSIVGLYAFGFRENRQGREDVAAAAYADAVMSPIVMAIGSTDVKWSDFKKKFSYPTGGKGWLDYCNSDGIVKEKPNGESALSSVCGWLGLSSSDYENNAQRPKNPEMSCAVVVMHEQDSAVATVGFRAVESARPGSLLSMPLFFTEVRFQGLANE